MYYSNDAPSALSPETWIELQRMQIRDERKAKVPLLFKHPSPHPHFSLNPDHTVHRKPSFPSAWRRRYVLISGNVSCRLRNGHSAEAIWGSKKSIALGMKGYDASGGR